MRSATNWKNSKIDTVYPGNWLTTQGKVITGSDLWERGLDTKLCENKNINI
jgi:hypothetical protein